MFSDLIPPPPFLPASLAGNCCHGNTALERADVQQHEQRPEPDEQLFLTGGVERHGGQQDEPDRELPAPEHDPGGAQEPLRQHRRDRVLQTSTRQNHR